MNKVSIIIKREYLTRVKKKSFLILTLLMPLFFAAIMILHSYLMSLDSDKNFHIAIADETGAYAERFEDHKNISFETIEVSAFDQVKKELATNDFYAVMKIDKTIESSKVVDVYAEKQINIDVKSTIDDQIENLITRDRLDVIYAESAIPEIEQRVKDAKFKVDVNTYKLSASSDGEEKAKKGSTEIAMAVGYATGFLIYMFVFIYGSMVMRSVLEEKQNRIVEVVISSVKPVQLMIGKIIGVVSVGITQVLIWLVLMGGIMFAAQSIIMPSEAEVQEMIEAQAGGQMGSEMMNQTQEVFTAIQNIDFLPIITSFIIFFILGFLLYSSLMSAIASAVDSEEDMNQFMTPIMLPFIAAIIIMMNVIKNPEGSLAIWTSYFPLTSPIIMMVRIPFGVAWWEVAISMLILAASTVGCIWVAAKIYRVGILMYGKKPSWKELFKWIRMS